MKISDIILNKIIFNSEDKFAAIIGTNPSNGAKSPILWNRVYKKQSKKTKMLCLDVEPKNFVKLLRLLEKNNSFIGGAITNPYKEKICSFLNKNIENNAKNIGSVNCIYRKNQKLFGTNTDGEGAIYSLKKLGQLKNKKFLIIGTGGTALTISAYLQKFLKNRKDLTITGRNQKKLNFFGKKFQSKLIKLKNLNNQIADYDFIINCTDVGTINKNYSIIDEKLFKIMKTGVKIFDVIYNPKKTPLLKLASKYKMRNKNGIDMNFQQAVFAFSITNKIKKSDTNSISELMI